MKTIIISLILTACSSVHQQAAIQTSSAIYQNQVAPIPFYMPYLNLYAQKIIYYTRGDN